MARKYAELTLQNLVISSFSESIAMNGIKFSIGASRLLGHVE